MVAVLLSGLQGSLWVLAAGLLGGTLALLPWVGWMLALLVFALAFRLGERRHLVGDFLLTVGLWLTVRQFAIALG